MVITVDMLRVILFILLLFIYENTAYDEVRKKWKKKTKIGTQDLQLYFLKTSKPEIAFAFLHSGSPFCKRRDNDTVCNNSKDEIEINNADTKTSSSKQSKYH